MAFQAVVSGDKHWLNEAPDTLLAPFDVNAAEMIDLSEWNIDYEQSAEEAFEFETLVSNSRGNIDAARTFAVPTTESYSVRVKDINRLDIPGSFSVVLYAADNVIGKTRVFQPSSPSECANCRKHGVFSTDFIVDRRAISPENPLRVAIEITNGNGESEEIPLSRAGNPTVNVRLLLNEV